MVRRAATSIITCTYMSAPVPFCACSDAGIDDPRRHSRNPLRHVGQSFLEAGPIQYVFRVAMSAHALCTTSQFPSWECFVGAPFLGSSSRSDTCSKSSSTLLSSFSGFRYNISRSDNKDKVETYLAFGASRFEACRPIAKEALRLSLTPNINQMRYSDAF